MKLARGPRVAIGVDAEDEPSLVAEPGVASPVAKKVLPEPMDETVRFKRDLELRPGKVERVWTDRVLLAAVDGGCRFVVGGLDPCGAQELHDPVLAEVPVRPTGGHEPNGQWSGSRGTETVHAAMVVTDCAS